MRLGTPMRTMAFLIAVAAVSTTVCAEAVGYYLPIQTMVGKDLLKAHPSSQHWGVESVGLLLLPGDGILVSDPTHGCVKKVEVDGSISTFAGQCTLTFRGAFGGDGGAATEARLNGPTGLALTADGGILVADTGNHRVRKVDAYGTITTMAGNGAKGHKGDRSLFRRGEATNAELDKPVSVSATADGGFLVSDMGSNTVRKVWADGTISKVAGLSRGDIGWRLKCTREHDGDPDSARALMLPKFEPRRATDACLFRPSSVAATENGGFLVTDAGHSSIYKVNSQGLMHTVVGHGTQAHPPRKGLGFLGPLNANAYEYIFPHPNHVSVTADGAFLVADQTLAAVYKVYPNGNMQRMAGGGSLRVFYDLDGPEEQLNSLLPLPLATASTPDGGFLVASGGQIVYVGEVNVVRARNVARGRAESEFPSLKRLAGEAVKKAQLRSDMEVDSQDVDNILRADFPDEVKHAVVPPTAWEMLVEKFLPPIDG